MGIFYNPPPPPTASNAGTPPEPHAPIGTQGSQPPRYTTALMIGLVLASWPLDLEPRLTRPNNSQNKIAPLTLTYGQQPPRYSVAEPMAVLSTIWPLDLEPRLGRPNEQRQKIAPLTLTYGSQPTPQPPISTVELQQIVATWAQSWDAQHAPFCAAWNVPPIVAFVASARPPTLVWDAWQPPFVAPPKPIAIAPLTLAYGSTPTPQPSITIPELTTILGAWASAWDAQTAPKNAAWNVPPLLSVLPYVPAPSLIWTAWDPLWRQPPAPVAIVTLTLPTGQTPPINPPLRLVQRIALGTWPADLEPRLTRPNDTRTTIAPLTLVYGTSPIPGPPLRSGPTRAIWIWHPPPTWAAQAWPPSIVSAITPIAPIVTGLIRMISDALGLTRFTTEAVTPATTLTDAVRPVTTSGDALTVTDATSDALRAGDITTEDLKDSN